MLQGFLRVPKWFIGWDKKGQEGKWPRKDRSDLSFARESITFGNSPQLLGLISLAVKSIKCIPVFIPHGCFEKNE